MNDELMEFAAAEITKMDDANAKRKEKVSKKAEENQPLIDRIANEILGTEPMTATDVATILELSVQKVSALCRAAVAQGLAVQSDIKVPKKGNQKAYAKA
jgi:hypothetical protein